MTTYKYWVYHLVTEQLTGPLSFKEAARIRDRIGSAGIILKVVVNTRGELVN